MTLNTLFTWAGVVVCALILAACICRVDMMSPSRNRWGWRLLYMLFAPYAGGVAIDLALGHYVDWWACWGIAGVLVHIVLTRRHWRDGPPSYTLKANP